MAEPDLNFLARQNERIITDIARLHDDLAVLTAIVMRLDSSHTILLQELRATPYADHTHERSRPQAGR
jgi:hypothetical protein